MGVSKVKLGKKTLIDLTNDTVSENNLLQGALAHGANGELIKGLVTIPTKTSELENDSGFFNSTVKNLMATEEGQPLDAIVGPEIDKRITANANAISELNSDLQTNVIKKFTRIYFLSKLNWAQSIAGYHYAELDSIPSGEYLSVCLGEIAMLRESDVIMPFIYQDKVWLFSSTDAFYNQVHTRAEIILLYR